MNRFLVAIALSLSFPLSVLASCTWTQSPTLIEGTMVCTSANESIPTLVTQGWQVNTCSKGVTIFICADLSGSRTLTGSGTVKVAVWNPVAAAWGEVPDRAMSPTVASARCQGFDGIWSVVNNGRFAVYPVSVGVSAGGFTAYFSCN